MESSTNGEIDGAGKPNSHRTSKGPASVTPVPAGNFRQFEQALTGFHSESQPAQQQRSRKAGACGDQQKGCQWREPAPVKNQPQSAENDSKVPNRSQRRLAGRELNVKSPARQREQQHARRSDCYSDQ